VKWHANETLGHETETLRLSVNFPRPRLHPSTFAAVNAVAECIMDLTAVEK